MKTPPLRLNFGPLFWRLFLVLAILAEVGLWHRLQPFVRNRDTRIQVAAMVLHSPKRLFRSFAWAALATVIADGYVRLVMRPVAARWYSPRRKGIEYGTPLEFLLGPREAVIAEIPGRRIVDRGSQPGRLVKTDRRLLFIPSAWEADALSIADADVNALERRPDAPRFGSLVLGSPDRVSVTTSDGEVARFAVADPKDVLGLYPDHAVVELDLVDHRVSPLELL